jgi:hypothetical protein
MNPLVATSATDGGRSGRELGEALLAAQREAVAVREVASKDCCKYASVAVRATA